VGSRGGENRFEMGKENMTNQKKTGKIERCEEERWCHGGKKKGEKGGGEK